MTVPVPERHGASKFGPTGPVLLIAALNINTCLQGPINTQGRSGESETWVVCSSNMHEDGKWGYAVKGKKKVGQVKVKEYEKVIYNSIYFIGY